MLNEEHINPIEENIERFFSYFSRQLVVLRALTLNNDQLEGTGPADHQIRFYQKVLVVTALDTLAGIRFPIVTYPNLNRKNRERFITFISEYSSWETGLLISLPFLYDNLCRNNVENSNLTQFVREGLSGYDPKEGIDLYPSDIDEPPERLLPLASTEEEEAAVWDCQHYSLLYRYRNFLVHESREPGHAMDGIRDGEFRAYYHGYINEESWFLGYPSEMFFELLNNSIENLKTYFSEQNVDPFEFVGDTTRW